MKEIKDEILFKFPKLKIKNDYAYGDLWVASKYCGLSFIPGFINREWQHGHVIKERNIHPEFVIGSDGLSRSRKNKNYYVARKDQVIFLNQEGYTNVTAIGMPIIYAEKPNVERIKDSLLIMPMHTLSQTSESFDEEEYAKFIDEISFKFKKIVCCLHKSCFEKKYWINTFSKRNIEIIQTADEDDANTLNRLSYLFSRFEYVTSNSFGSHLAYSAFFGAKPSICGPKPNWKPDDYKNLTFYKNVPALLDILKDWDESNYIKKCYDFLYLFPWEAKLQVEWAKFELGSENKKSSEELMKIFNWEKSMKKSNLSIVSSLKRMTIPFIKYRFKYRFRDANKIFTHLTIDEKYCLYNNVRQFKEYATCVEIGSYLGSSSYFIASGIMDGKLYCIDTWENHAMIYNDVEKTDERLMIKDTFDQFLKNTRKLKHKIYPLRGWSSDVIDDLKSKVSKIDFLFIDGDHNYEGVRKDWMLYSELLKKDSIVAFHDTGWAEGVKKVIEEYVIIKAIQIEKLPNLEVYKIL